jgi:hypothetical protein
MNKTAPLLLCFFLNIISVWAQPQKANTGFKIALPSHQGQLQWRADGFKIVQSSAKQNGLEIGIRGTNNSGRLTFLGFLFLIPGQAPLTSAKCRDGALEPEKKGNPTMKILDSSEIARPDGPPLDLVSYTEQDRDGKLWHNTRGFLASGDMCGDLEVYGGAPMAAEDPEIKSIWASYRLDISYTPLFNDVLLYSQILYRDQMYKAAAPFFELALTKVGDDKDRDQVTWRRVVTDQAGMAYGMSGNIPKARALFEEAVAKDPEYPMNYYNLACADAEEKKLADARIHLQQAFAHKSNVIKGESMPDPTKDDSFLPYRGNKEFWTFIESLR